MSWDISKFYIHDMELRRGPAYQQLTSALLIGLSRDFHFLRWCDYKNNLQIFKFLCDIMPSAMIMTHWIIKGGLLSQWEKDRSTVTALKNVFVHLNLLKQSNHQWKRTKKRNRVIILDEYKEPRFQPVLAMKGCWIRAPVKK